MVCYIGLRSSSSSSFLLGGGGMKLEGDDELALHIAIRKKKYDLARNLISEKNFDVNKEDEEGITPFIEAVLSGNIPIVVLMMRSGARVQPNFGFRHTPLRAACLTGNAKLITMLLEEGADPNAKSNGDRTPLMGACFLRKGYSKTLSLPAVQLMLKDARTDPTIKNSFGETALDLCQQRKYVESVEVLSQAAAGVKNT
eukprot:CAMPEP_0194139346 /NCGR_PEP_ID=MMETSP0152-20130528/8998_1 /TAXON_ID=1049557 /ORGANISM="Thalassiothrix antarctica, Strain L6-D1" /LENGTH=198 /DNA_ID=CAMNT_0038837133 /DNA_START=175 /DNA_END=767 /DNA_ORIENTATION=-